jgi:hypothetical protein
MLSLSLFLLANTMHTLKEKTTQSIRLSTLSWIFIIVASIAGLTPIGKEILQDSARNLIGLSPGGVLEVDSKRVRTMLAEIIGEQSAFGNLFLFVFSASCPVCEQELRDWGRIHERSLTMKGFDFWMISISGQTETEALLLQFNVGQEMVEKLRYLERSPHLQLLLPDNMIPKYVVLGDTRGFAFSSLENVNSFMGR